MLKTFTGRQVRGLLPTILVYAVLALVVYLLYRMVKKGLSSVFVNISDALNTDVDEQLEVTETNDGTTMTVDEIEQFQPIAKAIADQQEQALYEEGFLGMSDPDESAIFNPLLDKNGAQLREIYREYGQRRGRTLFETYTLKLSDGLFQSFTYFDDRVEGCTNYFDDCREVEFTRAIWQKSGIPMSF